MARNYQDVTASRRERLSPEAKAHREVFEQAYDIAVQIIGLRERHGLTQGELAERCGIDQGDISRIERGSTSPTARTLQRIAEALDSDVRLVAQPGSSRSTEGRDHLHLVERPRSAPRPLFWLRPHAVRLGREDSRAFSGDMFGVDEGVGRAVWFLQCPDWILRAIPLCSGLREASMVRRVDALKQPRKAHTRRLTNHCHLTAQQFRRLLSGALIEDREDAAGEHAGRLSGHSGSWYHYLAGRSQASWRADRKPVGGRYTSAWGRLPAVLSDPSQVDGSGSAP